MLGAGGYTPFDAGHCPYSLLEAVGRPALVRATSASARSLPVSAVTGVVADQPVALARDTVLDLARCRESRRFFTPLLVLSFGIFVSLCASRTRRYPIATACLFAGPSGFPFSWKGRAYRGRGDRRAVSAVIARSEATKQCSLLRLQPLDCFATLARRHAPGDARSVVAEEAAGIFGAEPLDHPPHAADALFRLERRRASAHSRLNPTGWSMAATTPERWNPGRDCTTPSLAPSSTCDREVTPRAVVVDRPILEVIAISLPRACSIIGRTDGQAGTARWC